MELIGYRCPVLERFQDYTLCMQCAEPFKRIRNKHHCKGCGKVSTCFIHLQNLLLSATLKGDLLQGNKALKRIIHYWEISKQKAACRSRQCIVATFEFREIAKFSTKTEEAG